MFYLFLIIQCTVNQSIVEYKAVFYHTKVRRLKKRHVVIIIRLCVINHVPGWSGFSTWAFHMIIKADIHCQWQI